MRSLPVLLLMLLLLPFTLIAEEDWTKHEITEIQPTSTFTDVDFDFDGDIDLLESARNADQLVLWSNYGDGTFSSEVIYTGINRPVGAICEDFDNDGDYDILLNYTDNVSCVGILWDTGTGYTFESLFSDEDLVMTPQSVDADLDGDLDAYVCTETELIWLLNDGAGTLARVLQPLFMTDVAKVRAVDVDHDFDIDLVVSGYFLNDAGIHYLENDGTNSYTYSLLHDADYRGNFVVAEQPDSQYMDVYIHPFYTQQIYRYRYNGQGFDSEVVSGPVSYPELYLHDFDQDGTSDVFIRSSKYGLMWYQRVDESDYLAWPIDNSQGLGFTTVSCFAVEDMDSDGDLDIICTEGSVYYPNPYHLSWWENPDYHLGVNIRETVDESGSVHLTWNDVNVDQYAVMRDGNLLAVTSQTEYDDQLPYHAIFEYTVTPDPQLPLSKESYPRKVFWPDADTVIEFADFDDGLPNSWEILMHQASNTWYADSGPDAPEQRLFDTPCMHNGLYLNTYPGPGWSNVWDGILASGVLTKDPTDRVEVGFDQIKWEIASPAENSFILLSPDGTPTHTIASYDKGQSNYQYFDLTDDLAGVTEFRIGFHFRTDYSFQAWAVDNVVVTVQPQPVLFTLTRQNQTIPPTGGTLIYDAAVLSELASPVNHLSYWIEVELPTGETINRTLLTGVTLPAFADISVPGITLSVPANAPSGQYTFTGYLGRRNYEPLQVSDSFTFQKLSGTVDAPYQLNPEEWISGNLDGWFASEQDGFTSLPHAYELAAPHPNPFNPTTTVGVSLPSAGELEVTVYNTLGQTVATLASGRIAAGKHQFVFDGSQLSSGVYFVHAWVPGELDQTCKIVLMK